MSDFTVSGLLALNDKKDAKIGELTARIRELDELIVDLSNETYPALLARAEALLARAEAAEAEHRLFRHILEDIQYVLDMDDDKNADVMRQVRNLQIAMQQALSGADGEAVSDD